MCGIEDTVTGQNARRRRTTRAIVGIVALAPFVLYLPFVAWMTVMLVADGDVLPEN
jgi:hypothetical protein